MNVICILQNAWGYGTKPIIFEPNPYNKSAKTIRKMVGKDFNIYFCNTTGVVTETAKAKPKIDKDHFNNVISTISLNKKYDIILVCGKQAEKAIEFDNNKERLEELNIPILYVPHPASRSLSNIQINSINQEISNLLKNKDN